MTKAIPNGIKAKPGQFVRFNTLGHFMRVDDYLSNGLGLIYKVNRDGATMTRFFF